MAPSDPTTHPLGFLLGAWRGDGRGEYPTIEKFGYTEEITFVNPPGKPFLAYTQRSAHSEDGRPLHSEAGYWRVPAPGRVELVLAHPTGLTEVYEGEAHGSERRGTTIELRSTVISRTATAKEVLYTERTFEVEGDELRYTMRMAAVGVGLTHHLSATLRRAASGA